MLDIVDRYEYSSNQKGTCIFYENKLCCINCVKPFGCTVYDNEYSAASNSNVDFFQLVKHEVNLNIARAWDTPENQKQIVNLLSFENDNEDQKIETFIMDGSEHTTNSITGCCDSFGKQCVCGGFMHYQPVYGGYYYECERCHKKL